MRYLVFLALCPFGLACVSSDAGYRDVRRLTSERLQRDVRWYTQEEANPSNEQTRALLAKPLDADRAVQVALLNNASVQAAFEQLGVARGRLVQALRLPNPTVGAVVGFHQDGDRRPELELEAMLDISDLLLLPLRGGEQSARLEAAKLEVAGQVIDLAFETRITFYEYQAAAQTLDLRRSIVAALRASFEVAQRLHEAGNIATLSFATERALYEESRVALTRAEANLAASREELSALLGLWGRETRWTAEERLDSTVPEPADLDQLEKRALERSLNLRAIERRFEAAGKGANAARVRGWLPELRAGVAAGREHDGEAAWTVGPAVELELPLLYQGQGETAAALAEQRREQKLYVDTAVRIRASARAIASRSRATRANVEYYARVLLPLRQQIVDETQLQYNAMNAGVFQLLQAKRDQIEAAQAYVDLLKEYWQLRAQLDQLIAGRLPRGGRAFAVGEVAAPSDGAGATAEH